MLGFDVRSDCGVWVRHFQTQIIGDVLSPVAILASTEGRGVSSTIDSGRLFVVQARCSDYFVRSKCETVTFGGKPKREYAHRSVTI